MRREEERSSSAWYIVVPTFPPSARFCHTLRCARKDDEGEGDGGGGGDVAGEGEEGVRGGAVDRSQSPPHAGSVCFPPGGRLRLPVAGRRNRQFY